MPVVEAVDLTKVYHNRHIALNALDLKVEKGMVYGLVGPNGAGKSTTFRLMMGLQRPTAGEVRVFGESMTAQRADLRRRMGFPAHEPLAAARHDADRLPAVRGQAHGHGFGAGHDPPVHAPAGGRPRVCRVAAYR